MEVECFKLTLKSDSLPTVREWAARMKNEMTEVRELLKNEGIALESVFLEENEEGAALIYYLRAPDLKKAREASRASKHPLDLYHQQVMKQVAASGKQLECLFDASGN
jgi:L-rhamnose mutarotase